MSDRVVALLLFGGALACYVTTLTPGLCYPAGDSHELALNAARLGVPHPSGYPLYTWLGFTAMHVLPFGTAAYRMNLLSALAASGAVALLYRIGRQLALPVYAAAAAAALLGIGTTLWSQAVITEVYPANIFMMTLAVSTMLRWAEHAQAGRAADARRTFMWFALIFGLALGTHISTLSFAPAYALFMLSIDPGLLRRPKEIAAAFTIFLLGVLQFAWLPLRGGLFDVYPNTAPTNLLGFYRYTIGAFGNLRFAVPWDAVPLQLLLYLRRLVANTGLGGVALGMLGMWIALARDQRRFGLFFLLFVLNVWIFSQFTVPDPDVFFLPSYVAWCVFVGFGVHAVGQRLERWPAMRVGWLVVLGIGLVVLGRESFVVNDRRTDTAVDDFLSASLAIMPPNSGLVTARGAFGADAAFWQSIYRTRPDVPLVSDITAPVQASGAPYFTMMPLVRGRPPLGGAPGEAPVGLEQAWFVPVVLGEHRAMLSRVYPAPPALVVREGSRPARLNHAFGAVTLLDAVITPIPDAARPRVHVETWWRVPGPGPVVVATRLGEAMLEAHELGHGNLPRWQTDVGPVAQGIVTEAYDLVLPSRGAHDAPLSLGVVRFDDGVITTQWHVVEHAGAH